MQAVIRAFKQKLLALRLTTASMAGCRTVLWVPVHHPFVNWPQNVTNQILTFTIPCQHFVFACLWRLFSSTRISPILLASRVLKTSQVHTMRECDRYLAFLKKGPLFNTSICRSHYKGFFLPAASLVGNGNKLKTASQT